MSSISYRCIEFECRPTSQVGKSAEYLGPGLKHQLGLEIIIWESSARWWPLKSQVWNSTTTREKVGWENCRYRVWWWEKRKMQFQECCCVQQGQTQASRRIKTEKKPKTFVTKKSQELPRVQFRWEKESDCKVLPELSQSGRHRWESTICQGVVIKGRTWEGWHLSRVERRSCECKCVYVS